MLQKLNHFYYKSMQMELEGKSSLYKKIRQHSELGPQKVPQSIFYKESNENESENETSLPNDQTIRYKAEELKDVGIVMSGSLELSIQGPSDFSSVSEKSPFCVLSETSLKFYRASGQSIEGHSPSMSLSLKQDIKTLFPGPLTLTINDSLVLTFQNEETLESWVVALKRLLPGKFPSQLEQKQNETVQVQNDIKPNSNNFKKKKQQEFLKNQRSKQSQIYENPVSQREEDTKEEKAGKTHSNHKCALTKCYENYRQCDVCNLNIPDSMYSAGCAECNFDLCIKCSSENRLDKSKALDVHPHPLIMHSSKERHIYAQYGDHNRYICNICRESLEGISYMCNLCDFDSCPTCYDLFKPYDPEANPLGQPSTDLYASQEYLKRVQNRHISDQGKQNTDFEASEYQCVIDLRDTQQIYDWTTMNTYQIINEQGGIVQGVEFKDRIPPVVMPIKTWEDQQEAQCHNCYYSDIDIINWSMNRSCTKLYMVSIYQFGHQDAYSLILDIYHFDEGQKTPFTSGRLSHISQLVKPTKQYILKNSDSTEDVRHYTDRVTIKILLGVSDDEKFIILFDRYTNEYHWLEVDSQNWKGNQEKATIEAYNRNVINHPYNLKIDDFYLEGSFLYIQHMNSSFYKLGVPITDWSPALEKDEVKEFHIDDFSLTQIIDIIRLEYYDVIIYPDKLNIYDVISRELTDNANCISARFMEIHKCNGVIVSPDSGYNSIRKTQIDAFTQNDKEGSPSIIETFLISRLRPSEDNELTFEIEDLETYKLNLEHPLHPSERDEQQKQKLHYTIIANHQKYYFFKVTGCGDSIYFQKYLYDTENNEIDYVNQIKIIDSLYFPVPQLASLPYYALDWKQFVYLNNSMEIINTKEVRYVDMIEREQINNIGNIYFEDFIEKLFQDAAENELLGLKGCTIQQASQIPQNDMVIYFVNDEEEQFYGILFLQVQKQIMKLFKSQKKCKIIQQKTINRKDYFNLHLFLREISGEILQYVVKIEEETIEIFPSKLVCTEKMDLVGSFLSENAQTFSVIFSGLITKRRQNVNASDLLNNIRGQPRKEEHQKLFSAFYQYTIEDDYADPESLIEWKDENNDQTIIIFQEDDEEDKFTDKIAQIINKVARGYPVEVAANFQDRFREVMLKQFEMDESYDFFIIAFKNKFILYKPYTSIAYFLNDDFHIQSIVKFKNRIIKIQAIDSDYPDDLEYIQEDYSKQPLQIGVDSPFLPVNLFFHENLITEYEIGSDYLSFFQSFQKRYSYQKLAILRLRKKQNDVLDIVEKQELDEDSQREKNRRKNEKPKNNMELLLKEIRENDLDYILSFSLVTKQNIFTATKSHHDRDIIYEAIQNKLELSVIEELPLLIYNLEEDDKSYRSILDILIDNKAFSLTQLIISLALTQDKTGLMYDELTRYIDKLNFSMKDVKLYLESQICFRRISSEYFDELQPNGDTIIFPCSEKDSIVDIVRDFKRIEAQMLGTDKREAKGGSKLNQIITASIEVSEMDSRVMEEHPLRRRESYKQEEEEEELPKQVQEYPIEYYVINLMKMKKAKQEVLRNESFIVKNEVSQKIEYTVQERKEVTDVLIKLAEKDQSVLEIETLQIIIEFKWKSYTQFFFTMQLILFTLYIIAFIVDVVAISRNTGEFDTQSVKQITPRCICMLILSILFAYEVFDLIRHPLAYYRRFWNHNDQFLFFVYTIFFVISFAKPQWTYALKSLQLVLVISTFIKLSQLIRIWTKLSFMVKMLVTVFFELRYFLFFFLLVIGGLTVMIQIILKDSGENYEGIKTSAFFVLALRQSIGDYDTSSLIDGTDNFKILAWLLYFLILIVGNVVFMNFIIAVVSESYENCMEKKIQSIQMAKLQMIQECESLLPEWCFLKENWFPKFIIFRRQQDAESPDGEGDQWQGFVKQIRHHFEQEVAIIRQQFKLQRNRSEENKNLLKSSIAQNKSQMSDQNERMFKQIGEVHSRVNTMEKKMEGMKDTLEDIKKMLIAASADKEK